MPDTALHPLHMALKNSGTVPWMLEAAIGLELILDKYVEAAIIAFLLILMQPSDFFRRAELKRPLPPVKSPVALNASVRRDRVEKRTAAELVQGDVVKPPWARWSPRICHITGGEVLLRVPDHAVRTRA